jgi:16S rRNA (guanine527-N7)-methyltransferase
MTTDSAVERLTAPVRARLSDLATRHALDGDQVARLAGLLVLVAGDPLAPTTVRAPGDAADQHLADSLVALDLAMVRGARASADIGAGAGFPGLALAIALPDCRWQLIESVRRKTQFIERAIATVGLANASALNLRTEEWREGRAANDLVTARAVAPAPVVLEYAAPLMRLGGSLVDWRTGMNADEARSARSAASQLGLEPHESRAVTPFAGAHSRHLYVYMKVRETPERFPRRAGIARKKPLGGSTRG